MVLHFFCYCYISWISCFLYMISILQSADNRFIYQKWWRRGVNKSFFWLWIVRMDKNNKNRTDLLAAGRKKVIGIGFNSFSPPFFFEVSFYSFFWYYCWIWSHTYCENQLVLGEDILECFVETNVARKLFALLGVYWVILTQVYLF